MLHKNLISTAILALENGKIFRGIGAGIEGVKVGELCFNTAMTGYQEILTDPSYANQIITFTFPHIGIVGTNEEDIEHLNVSNELPIKGAVFNSSLSEPSNYRNSDNLNSWLIKNKVTAIHNIDTRALTNAISEEGLIKACIAYNKKGEFNIDELVEKARSWEGIENIDLAMDVTTNGPQNWHQTKWQWNEGFRKSDLAHENQNLKVVAINYGLKRNILRLFTSLNVELTILPANTSYDEIMSYHPDGVFLSNGPGDPKATGKYTIKEISKLIDDNIPIFGICLGHQILALAMGAQTKKMHMGHHGANHPVKDLITTKVEITSMNHGFCVDNKTLPTDVIETHISLFDQTNCGIKHKQRPIFSVQYHPEASPGPQDSYYLFNRFLSLVKNSKLKKHEKA